MDMFISALITIVAVTVMELTDAKPAAEVKYYATKYDHLDVEMILNNRRMVNYYATCLLSQGPCPPEGVEFKRILPEALQTNCGRCTEKQATVTLRAIRRLKKEYPKIWSQLAEKWDPDDIYVKKFESTFGSKTKISVSTQDSTPNTPTAKTDSGNPETTTVINQITSSPNNIMRIPYSTSTESPISYSTASTSASTITTSTAKATSTTARVPPPIPGLVPINTFFTNPPIPLRPIAGLNLGANIGATVMAIKQVEKAVADIALMKIGMIKSMFLTPWRKTRRRKRGNLQFKDFSTHQRFKTI